MDIRLATPADAQQLLTLALAFRDLAENAGKIGELNISPDLLNTLLKPDGPHK